MVGEPFAGLNRATATREGSGGSLESSEFGLQTLSPATLPSFDLSMRTLNADLGSLHYKRRAQGLLGFRRTRIARIAPIAPGFLQGTSRPALRTGPRSLRAEPGEPELSSPAWEESAQAGV